MGFSVDIDLAQSIYEGLITSGYVKKGVLTDKYYEDKKKGSSISTLSPKQKAPCPPWSSAILRMRKFTARGSTSGPSVPIQWSMTWWIATQYCWIR
jgi:hypothetical protein